MIFILVDSKKKKVIYWLIVVITFFSAETGIIMFLIWQIYKQLIKNTRHGHYKVAQALVKFGSLALTLAEAKPREQMYHMPPESFHMTKLLGNI